MLHQTLARLQCTDWKESPYIQMDTWVSSDPRARQTANVKNALEWFLAHSEADFALVLEDDLDFNLHLRWNLERWSPIAGRSLNFGNLYNPSIWSSCNGVDHFVADPGACYGSQLVFEERNYPRFSELGSGHRHAGHQSDRLIGGAGLLIYYHRPSLVQHLGTKSVWGGRFHFATDFGRNWKTRFSYERIPGWFTFPKLYQYAVDEAAEGDVLVEVGAWLGRSTAFLAERAIA